MIGIKGLAIGDLVLHKSKPGRIVALSQRGIEVLFFDYMRIALLHCKDIEPMPISVGVLQRMGFEPVDGVSRWEHYLDDGEMRIVIQGLGCSHVLKQRYQSNGDWETHAQCTCFGVHQMQHFFTMTNIDIDIEL